jgi:hypothetical protein
MHVWVGALFTAHLIDCAQYRHLREAGVPCPTNVEYVALTHEDILESERVVAEAAEALRAAGYEVFCVPPDLKAKIEVPGDNFILIQREVGDNYGHDSIGGPRFNSAMENEIAAILERFGGDSMGGRGEYGVVGEFFDTPHEWFDGLFDRKIRHALVARHLTREALRRATGNNP